jgi:hypothetical protein
VENVNTIYSGIEHGAEDIYEQALTDAGYCYDKFDVHGAGNAVHIHCIWLGRYDAVVWGTGPANDMYLFDKEAQDSIRWYLDQGGRVVICGDRVAYNLAPPEAGGLGADSLGGEFLAGVLGCEYIEEQESPFLRPYVYLEAADTMIVSGNPVPIELDSLLLYRECPGRLKDMSYVRTNDAPPAGYTAQAFVDVLDPPPSAEEADGAIYVEKPVSGGQCVFINADLSGFINQETTECDGTTPGSTPDFNPGSYGGRGELLLEILEDLFGLPSGGGGGGGTTGTKPSDRYHWHLAQNTPNPFMGETRIDLEVARASRVSVKVYDTLGRLVCTLSDRLLDAGRYSLTWDGRNSDGERVSGGVYFYKIKAGAYSATRKMLMLR